jgi:hypothetical protein
VAVQNGIRLNAPNEVIQGSAHDRQYA